MKLGRLQGRSPPERRKREGERYTRRRPCILQFPGKRLGPATPVLITGEGKGRSGGGKVSAWLGREEALLSSCRGESASNHSPAIHPYIRRGAGQVREGHNAIC